MTTLPCCRHTPGRIPRRRLPRSSRAPSISFIPWRCGRCATRISPRKSRRRCSSFWRARRTRSVRRPFCPAGSAGTARYAGANALTIQRRRQHREQEAHMQSILNEAANEPAETWNQIAPLLDGAMEQLGQKDHDALVLRFFENKNFAEVGAALGASEDAAKMRVNRALEKLRKFFTKRGVSSTTAILAGTISANSVQAAPVTLAKSATA